MRFHIVVLSVCMSLGTSLNAQSKAPSSKKPISSADPAFNVIDQKVVRNYPARSLINPFICDTEGNIYLQAYTGGASKTNPVTKIDREGNIKASYSVSALGNRFGVQAFNVTSSGELYMLGWEKKTRDIYAVSFGDDGSVKNKTKLDISGFSPRQFAVFDNGEIIVAGFEHPTEDNPYYTTPYTALFSASGQFIKRLRFPDDEKLAEDARNRDTKSADNVDPDTPNQAVELSRVAPSPDGNIYLMRSTSPAIVYRITPAGEITNRIVISPQAKDFNPSEMWADGRNLALIFWETDLPVGELKIIDTDSGKVTNTYSLGPPLGGGVACYSKDGLTFLSQKDGELLLKLATVR